jgi:hypothetical protein
MSTSGRVWFGLDLRHEPENVNSRFAKRRVKGAKFISLPCSALLRCSFRERSPAGSQLQSNAANTTQRNRYATESIFEMSEICRLVTERRKENSKESWVNPDPTGRVFLLRFPTSRGAVVHATTLNRSDPYAPRSYPCFRPTAAA